MPRFSESFHKTPPKDERPDMSSLSPRHIESIPFELPSPEMMVKLMSIAIGLRDLDRSAFPFTIKIHRRADDEIVFEATIEYDENGEFDIPLPTFTRSQVGPTWTEAFFADGTHESTK